MGLFIALHLNIFSKNQFLGGGDIELLKPPPSKGQKKKKEPVHPSKLNYARKKVKKKNFQGLGFYG